MKKPQWDLPVKREVDDIIEMFRCMKRSFDAFEDQSGIETGGLLFFGFEGNKEGEQYHYYVQTYGHERREELFAPPKAGSNSHWPTMNRYRAMLAAWRSCPDPQNLSKNDLLHIATVGRRF